MTRLHEVDAYLMGELIAAEADAFEQAMFESPDDPDLGLVDRIARHGVRLIAHGTFDMSVTRRHIEELIANGHTVHVADRSDHTQRGNPRTDEQHGTHGRVVLQPPFRR